jgi:hypothetical protein
MRFKTLLLIIAVFISTASVRFDFTRTTASETPVISAAGDENHDIVRQFERCILAEAEEVEQSDDTEALIICRVQPDASIGGVCWVAFDDSELGYYRSARDLFNHLGRLRI